ncbi:MULTISPECIES: hypothetical protein [Mannheimia]|uniref:DUF3761 domain-containing protein n=1 Tax=Mannheimia indoligenes TaxID=3103145 RepID=A0ABU7ZBZ1_9PAST|nr:hypothetical protein [Mannheimia sp. USDA-ARS-USMARC-1261]
MLKHKIIISLMAFSIIACSSNKPVKVVSGDNKLDYAQQKNIHISESTLANNTTTTNQNMQKPKNATALCFNGIYSTDIQNPCANQGGVKEKYSHYYAD